MMPAACGALGSSVETLQASRQRLAAFLGVLQNCFTLPGCAEEDADFFAQFCGALRAQFIAQPHSSPALIVSPVLHSPVGWLPHPRPPPLLVQVSRTTLGQQIPVYTEFKNGRTRRLTIVRRVTGSEDALAKELYRVTGGASIAVRTGRVEVEGDRSKELKTWLAGLGF